MATEKHDKRPELTEEEKSKKTKVRKIDDFYYKQEPGKSIKVPMGKTSKEMTLWY